MTVARAARPPVVNSLVACDHRQMVGRLVGREAELDRIAGAVVSARGGTSRCLLITGEAGIGKSRLVADEPPDHLPMVTGDEAVDHGWTGGTCDRHQ